MTLQNLNKILDKYEQQLGIARPPSPPQQLELLKGLHFYTEWQAAAPSVQKEAQKSSLSFNHVIELLKSLPFYDWEHEAGFGQNCAQSISFNHAIGLPQKDGSTFFH